MKAIKSKKEVIISCIVPILLSAVIIVALFSPAVQYTSGGEAYTLSGFDFLFGKVIASGSVTVAPNALVWVSGVAVILALLAVLLRSKLGQKKTAVAQIVLACVIAFVSVAFSMRVEGILSTAGAKRVGVLWGHYIAIGAAFLLLLNGLYQLYKEGTLPDTFDVIGWAVGAILSMIVPFATYTYKKVSHPFTGFDMMTNKVINGDGDVAPGSYLPYIMIALAILIIVLALIRPKRRRAVAGLLLLCAAGIIVCTIFMSSSAETMLEEAKSVDTTFFSLLPVLFAIGVFAKALYILYLEETLSVLDFMAVPGLIYLLINNYIPMLGIALAFKKIDYSIGIWESPWCGFDNFKYLFQTSTAFIIVRNTLLYNVAFIALGLFTGLVVGICLFAVSKKVVQTFYQTSILLPQLISMIVVAYIVYAFLSNDAGFINKKILGDDAINFYTTKSVWPFLLTFVNNWKQIGYNAVIFLSSIVGINSGLYEAAMVDGAGPWKQITKIMIPQLKPTIITLGMLQLGRVFYSDFGLFYQVTMDNGAIYNVTNTIDTYVYRSLMVLNNISNSAAASAFQAVCGFVLVLTVNMIVRKIDRDNALF